MTDFFGYLIFIAFLLACSVTTAWKAVGGGAPQLGEGDAGLPFAAASGAGAPGPATTLAERATACCFGLGSLPSSTLLPGTCPALPHEPAQLLLSSR